MSYLIKLIISIGHLDIYKIVFIYLPILTIHLKYIECWACTIFSLAVPVPVI